MRLLTYAKRTGAAVLAGVTLANPVLAKENQDENWNGISDTIDEEISELLFDNIPITDGRYNYNVLDLNRSGWDKVVKPGYVTEDDIQPRGEKAGKRVFEARAPDGATYLVFTRNGEITKHVVERTREENKEILETLIKEKFHGKYRFDKITDADLEIYKTEIDSLVNNNGIEIIESANAAVEFGSFSIEALPHFATIGENGGIDFLWLAGHSFGLPYEGADATLRVSLTSGTEVIEMVANLAKDKEFTAVLFEHFPVEYFSLKEADVVRKNPDAREIIVQKGAELAKSYERNLGDTPTAVDLETMVVLGKRDDMKFFDTLGTMMSIPEYDRANFSRNINLLAAFGSTEFLVYARDTLGLNEITTSLDLMMLGEIAMDNGSELLHILHEQYGLKKITALDLLALKVISQNIGAKNLAYIAETFDVPSLSTNQLYELAKVPKEAIDILVANGEKPFKYARENFGMQRLELEELEPFSAFISREVSSNDEITLYSPKVKERYDIYKKVFGLETAGGVYERGVWGVYTWHNLEWLLRLSRDDYAHDTLMSKGKDIHEKAKQLGLWDDLEMGDITKLAGWYYSTEETGEFLERMVAETPVKKIPDGGVDIIEMVMSGLKPQFFGLIKYITVPEVSFDEWITLTLNYDFVTTNGNASLFNRYGISHFERYDQGVLDRVADREIDNPNKPVAVMVYNKNDWNDAFRNDIQRQMFREVGAHHAVGLYETVDDTGMFAALDDVGKEATIDLAVFGTHGSPVSMILGYSPCKDNIDEETGIVACGEESYYDLSDVSDLALRAGYFSPDAIVILDACSTGAGGLTANNLANGTARALPGRTIVAANQPVGGFTIKYDSGKPKEILADNLPFMTYAVRYVNGKLEQVDPNNL